MAWKLEEAIGRERNQKGKKNKKSVSLTEKSFISFSREKMKKRRAVI